MPLSYGHLKLKKPENKKQTKFNIKIIDYKCNNLIDYKVWWKIENERIITYISLK